MGAVNVGAVLTTWTSLPHRARVVLVAMAHVALDAPRDGAPARRYFGGPGYLAEVLYGPAGIERHEDGRPIPTRSAGSQVEKVLTELVKAGAVRRVVAGGRRHRSEYEVVLTPPDSPTETVGLSPTETVGQPHRNGGYSPTETVGPRNTRNHEENQEDNITSRNHLTSRATALAAEDEIPAEPDIDPTTLTGIKSADAYPDALAHLERTLGTARAGTAVAALLDAGYQSHTEAVVRAALVSGWTP